MKRIEAYPETHQQGFLSVEATIDLSLSDCDFGIQIADDGRIWVCVDGVAFLRFKPKYEKDLCECQHHEISFKGGSDYCQTCGKLLRAAKLNH